MALTDVEDYIEANPGRWIPGPEIAKAMDAQPPNTYKQLARLRKRNGVLYCKMIVPENRNNQAIYHYKCKED